jgi:hypothetical protein
MSTKNDHCAIALNEVMNYCGEIVYTSSVLIKQRAFFMNRLPTLYKVFPNGHQALSVRTNGNTDAASIVEALNLSQSRRLFILSGGAGGMSKEIVTQLSHLFITIGQMLAQMSCTVIDGGTESGVMRLMGRALARAGQNVPHIGVVPARAQAGPNGIEAEDVLDPHHSNFVLVDSDEWGGEVQVMYRLANYLSRQVPSLAMLVNGGGISLQEVEQNVAQGREIIVISGSGRLADEITEAMLYPKNKARKRIRHVVQNGRLILHPLENPPNKLMHLLKERLY